ncbi:MAG: hypothetical protein M1824_000439 [Vezdaea acicularis]|nr:MAG: hypothetical protein M1824_000439 [Vezdaea acicularis]
MSSSGKPMEPASAGAAGGAEGNRRRSSAAGNAGLFNGLMNQKRNSTDITAAARRSSFAEQKPQAGFIGQMWHNFTKGDGK